MSVHDCDRVRQQEWPQPGPGTEFGLRIDSLIRQPVEGVGGGYAELLSRPLGAFRCLFDYTRRKLGKAPVGSGPGSNLALHERSVFPHTSSASVSTTLSAMSK